MDGLASSGGTDAPCRTRRCPRRAHRERPFGRHRKCGDRDSGFSAV